MELNLYWLENKILYNTQITKLYEVILGLVIVENMSYASIISI